MDFLCYTRCSTCRKAKQWLNAHNVEYTERDIAGDNPSYSELASWYERSGLPLKKLFNTSGTLYKDMHLKDKLGEMSDEDQLQLLATNGLLVKRPVLVTDNAVLFGFKESEWEEILE